MNLLSENGAGGGWCCWCEMEMCLVKHQAPSLAVCRLTKGLTQNRSGNQSGRIELRPDGSLERRPAALLPDEQINTGFPSSVGPTGRTWQAE